MHITSCFIYWHSYDTHVLMDLTADIECVMYRYKYIHIIVLPWL